MRLINGIYHLCDSQKLFKPIKYFLVKAFDLQYLIKLNTLISKIALVLEICFSDSFCRLYHYTSRWRQASKWVIDLFIQITLIHLGTKHVSGCVWNHPLYQWYSNLALEIHFSRVQLQPWSNSPTCDFLMILKTLISMLRCVWSGLELNSSGKWISQAIFEYHCPIHLTRAVL